MGHGEEEESSVDRVEGFGDVDVDDGSMGAGGGEGMGKEGGEVDVVLNPSAREKGSLLGPNGRAEGSSKACGKDFGEEAVEGWEEGDGAVGGGGSDGGGPWLEEGGDSAVGEVGEEALVCAHGREQAGKEGGPAIIANAPQGVGESIYTRGGSGGAGGEGGANLFFGDLGISGRVGKGRRDGVGVAGSEVRLDRSQNGCLGVGVGGARATDSSIVVSEAEGDGGVGGKEGPIRGT
jgi:hypothetical protein